jgi:hypothetical protein
MNAPTLMMQVLSLDFRSPMPASGFPLRRASVERDIGGYSDVMFPEPSVAAESVARHRFTIHDTPRGIHGVARAPHTTGRFCKRFDISDLEGEIHD